MSAVAAGFACPGCGEAMARRVFARRPHGEVTLDICFGCQAIWFDHYESSQLTPGATVELFRAIEAAGDGHARPASASSKCPVCHQGLLLTHDIQRTNRFTYHRCPEWHGRFITFFQFLREKQFVRSLSNAELDQLRVTVKQVRCSSCGGPIAIERDAACRYCQAPVSILDAAAVERTLRDLAAEEHRRPRGSPTAAIDALIAGRRTEARLARFEQGLDGTDFVAGSARRDRGPLVTGTNLLAALPSNGP